MNDSITLGMRLKELRQRLGVNQQKFADDLGISKASLGSYETGSKNPTSGVLINIAKKYLVSLDWLCGMDDERKIEVNTYTDFFKLLFLIEDTKLAKIRPCEMYEMAYNNGITMPARMEFYDGVIDYFIGVWRKTHELYEDGTIDETLYMAWKDKVFKDFDLDVLRTENQHKEFKKLKSTSKGLNDYEQTVHALRKAMHVGGSDEAK